MRCFLCTEIKSPEIITEALQFQAELKSIGVGIKFVESENLHLTLKFLGEIDPALVDDIHSIMKKIPFSPFIISLQGVGTFPPSRPRVIWIGITEGQDELSSIISFLNKNLKNLGFKPETRTESAHLTIGRVKFVTEKKSLINLLQKWKDHPFGKINVTSIQLKKSL